MPEFEKIFVSMTLLRRRDVSRFFFVYHSAIKERELNNDNFARAFKEFRLPSACSVEECSELKRATSLTHGRQPEASCFSYLTSLDTTTFILSSIVSLVEAISLTIWERLACEMFTSGFRPWLKKVACLTFLIGLKNIIVSSTVKSGKLKYCYRLTPQCLRGSPLTSKIVWR